MRKTTGLADVLRQALQPLGDQVQLAFVFGSMASGSAMRAAMWICSWWAAPALPRWWKSPTPPKPSSGAKSTQSHDCCRMGPKRAEGNSFVEELLAKPKADVDRNP